MRRLFLLSALILGACQTPPPPAVPGEMAATGAVVATVDGMSITQDMIDAATRGATPEQIEEMKSTGRWPEFLEQIALGQALYQKALADKLHEDPGVKMRLALQVREALANEAVSRVADAAVSDDKLLAAYEARKVQYPPQVKARHVLVKEEAEAAEVVELLKAGADFGKVAAEKSTDPGSKDKGGELGWFSQRDMVKEFAEAAFASTGDEIVGPVQTRFGYHILQVTERRDATPFEDVKGQLAEEVKRDAAQAFIAELRGSMDFKLAGDATPAAGGEPAAMPEGAPEAAPATP
jgi:peptidyl-prolyl cis-trans isomerase C